jgi:hypothetical protein
MDTYPGNPHCMRQRAFFLWRAHCVIFLMICLTTLAAQAQQDRFSGWFFYLNTVSLDAKKKWSLHTDIQLRSTDEWKQTETFIFRPGLNYHISKKDIVTLGYALIEGWRTLGGVRDGLAEHRIWQQYILLQPFKKASLQHRFRLEERFIPVAEVSGDELKRSNTLYSTRFRYFFRALIPFKSEKVFKKGAYAALQEELFFNITHTSNVNEKLFDQNRAYAAFGWRFSPSLDLEAGYMNQYIIGRGAAFTNNHIMQLALYLRR